MKKIMMFVFTLLVSFMVLDGANAEEFICNYQNSKEGSAMITFEITENELLKFVDIGYGDVDGNWVAYGPKDYDFDNIDYNKFTCPKKIFLSKQDKKIVVSISNETQGNFTLDGEYYISEGDVSVSCLQYQTEESCKTSDTYACVWVENDETSKNLYDSGEKKGYCNVDNLLYVACGDAKDIPVQVPALISFAVNLLKIATPIILIFVSAISLLKALAAQKEDEIKKAQSGMIRKIIAAVLVFFVISIVQFVIGIVADTEIKDTENNTEYDNFSTCLDCFLNNSCEVNKYYKTVIAGEDYCTRLSNGSTFKCTLEKDK